MIFEFFVAKISVDLQKDLFLIFYFYFLKIDFNFFKNGFKISVCLFSKLNFIIFTFFISFSFQKHLKII